MQTEVLGRRELIRKSALLGAGLVISNLPEFQISENPYYIQFRTIETENGQIIIEAGSAVNPRALETAESEFLRLTDYRIEMRSSLAGARYKIAIIPQRANINILPEYASFTEQSKGWTARRGRELVTAISEGNLLGTLTGDRLEDWYTSNNFLIAPHEYGHAINMSGITSDERSNWRDKIFPVLSSRPGFPGNWRSIYPHTYEALRNRAEMFPELTRGVRQGFGPPIKRMDINNEAGLEEFLFNIYGPF